LTDANPISIRQVPHNLEAEQALLGAILINNDAFGRVSDFLTPEEFYDPLHREIYKVAGELIAGGKPATPITLKTFFETAPPIDATLTVPQYLGRLAGAAVGVTNAKDYAETVHDLHTRRHLILIGEDMINAAYDSPVNFSPKAQIEEAEARLYRLTSDAMGAREGGSVVSRPQPWRPPRWLRPQPKRRRRDQHWPDGFGQGNWRAVPFRFHHPGRSALDGKDGACHQHHCSQTCAVIPRPSPLGSASARSWRRLTLR
jgi:DnaB-like helicase N terminal domain